MRTIIFFNHIPVGVMPEGATPAQSQAVCDALLAKYNATHEGKYKITPNVSHATVPVLELVE